MRFWYRFWTFEWSLERLVLLRSDILLWSGVSSSILTFYVAALIVSNYWYSIRACRRSRSISRRFSLTLSSTCFICYSSSSFFFLRSRCRSSSLPCFFMYTQFSSSSCAELSVFESPPKLTFSSTWPDRTAFLSTSNSELMDCSCIMSVFKSVCRAGLWCLTWFRYSNLSYFSIFFSTPNFSCYDITPE